MDRNGSITVISKIVSHVIGMLLGNAKRQCSALFQILVNGGLNAQKTEADIWRIMPPYFDQEKGGDLAPF